MNWADYFAMGGYAFYVWTAYGLMAAVLVLNLLLPLWRKSAVLAEIARRMAREGRQ
jgi:heme exporter protein D